jgi:glycosyltransferase involved in cell wall biosynthesis
MVLSGLGAGGAERVASEMLNFWAESGREVGLLTLAQLELDHYTLDPRVTRIGLDIIWPSRNIWHGLISNFRRMRMIRAAILDYAPGAVISFIDRTNIMVLAALLGTRIPVTISERVDPCQHTIDWIRRGARRCLYPFAKVLVVQTDSVAPWGRRVMLAKRKVAVIENPVTELPEPSAFSSRPHNAVAIGRLTRQKGFDLLIQAFAASRMRAAGWHLNIVGEGPERNALENLISSLGMTEEVTLVGVVDKPWAWLDRARAFVLPSRYEGFPNALLEAMSMGCASVAADCPSGPADIIVDGHNGMLVPVDNVDALVSALDHIETHPTAFEDMSYQARAVRERFDIKQIMQKWDNLLRNNSAR